MDASRYFKEIRNANHHHGGLKCQKVFQVKSDFFDSLASEALAIVERYRPSEVGVSTHATNWTRPFGEAVQYSLLNASGRFDDFSTDHNSRCDGKRFHHPSDFPCLGAFIGAFPHATNMRLNGMGARSGLSPHEEHTVLYPGDGTAFIRARFHLPLVTNPDAQMLLDGELYRFEAGTIYYFNNGCVHGARNLGETFRYHLVWDMMFTQETYRFMFGSEDDPAPAFLRRYVGEGRDCVRVGAEQIHDYAISGPGQALYDSMDLEAIGVRPGAFHDLYNEAVFYREVRSRFVFSGLESPPSF